MKCSKFRLQLSTLIKSKRLPVWKRNFLSKAGLKVKVYRRFCNVWIEATLTEEWTLEQQNTEGQLLSELNGAAV